MLLEQLLPQLPQTNLEWFIVLSGAVGSIMVIYSQFLSALNRRDLVRAVGSFAAFVYAYWTGDYIFILLTLGFFIASTVEFIEIYLGYHRSEETQVKKYKEVNKKFN
ncbi:MAG: hypothetical protein ABEJ02_00625 [Candidatus Paceibacteria bacterium]